MRNKSNARVFSIAAIMSVMSGKILCMTTEVYALANFMLNYSLEQGTLPSVLPILRSELRRQIPSLMYYRNSSFTRVLDYGKIEVIIDFFGSTYGKAHIVRRIDNETISLYFENIDNLCNLGNGQLPFEDVVKSVSVFSTNPGFSSEKSKAIITPMAKKKKEPELPVITDLSFDDMRDPEFEALEENTKVN